MNIMHINELNRPEYVTVDFDGTLCTHKFPEIGEPIPEVIEYVMQLKAAGSKIILLTSREDEPERAYLSEALAWCKNEGVPIDAVNENPWCRFSRRKVYGDINIDDRNIHPDDIITLMQSPPGKLPGIA